MENEQHKSTHAPKTQPYGGVNSQSLTCKYIPKYPHATHDYFCTNHCPPQCLPCLVLSTAPTCDSQETKAHFRMGCSHPQLRDNSHCHSIVTRKSLQAGTLVRAVVTQEAETGGLPAPRSSGPPWAITEVQSHF